MISLKFLWTSNSMNIIKKIINTPIILFLIILFRILNFLPKKNIFTFLWINKTSDSNITPMYDYHKSMGDNVKLIDLRRNRSVFKILLSSYRSKYIYIDQNIFTLFLMPLNKITVVQLGHGSCRIKGVGLYQKPKPISQLITKGKSINDIIIAASDKTAEEVGKAYDVEFKNVLVTNEPRKVREKIKNGTGVLFCPTFRIIDGKYVYPDNLIDLEKLKYLGKKLFIKYHPVSTNTKIPSWATDATDYSIEKCVMNTNIIISDYSSVTTDYLCLSTEAYFISHIPDLKDYTNNRGLMPSWKLFISDQQTFNTEELVKAINNPLFSNMDSINKIGLMNNSDSLKKIREYLINFDK